MLKKVNLPDGVKRDVPLKNYSSFRIGGPAKYFYEAIAPAPLARILSFAKRHSLRWFVLGGGTNVLFSDKGFDGLIVRLAFDKFEIRGERILAEAGANLQVVISACVKRGLAGLENLAGIPGTIGGAVRGNAGAHGAEISGAVAAVKVFDSRDCRVRTIKKSAMKFSYRNSLLKKRRGLIILSIVLKLKKVKDRAALIKTVRENLVRRNSSQPRGLSAGCIFMNPAKKVRGRLLSAGELIDKVCLKGTRINGAVISKTHANFFVNKGGAKASDITALINLAKKKVYKKFKIRLMEEIEIVK